MIVIILIIISSGGRQMVGKVVGIIFIIISGGGLKNVGKVIGFIFIRIFKNIIIIWLAGFIISIITSAGGKSDDSCINMAVVHIQ